MHPAESEFVSKLKAFAETGGVRERNELFMARLRLLADWPPERCRWPAMMQAACAAAGASSSNTQRRQLLMIVADAIAIALENDIPPMPSIHDFNEALNGTSWTEPPVAAPAEAFAAQRAAERAGGLKVPSTPPVPPRQYKDE